MRWPVLGFLACAAAAPGCSASKGALDYVRYCSSASDCEPDEVCAAGVCSLPGSSPDELIVEFVPPQGPSAWLPAGRLDETHEAAIALDPPSHVDITVEGVESAIVAFTQPSLIGRAPFIATGTTEDAIDLPPGVYSTQVIPSDPGIPPFAGDEMIVDGKTESFHAQAPPSGHLLGRVAWYEGVGIDGAEVQVFAVDSDRQASQPALTAPCVADGLSGCFDVAVATDESQVRVRVRSPADRKGAPVPTVWFERTLDPFVGDPAEPQMLGDLVLDAFGQPIVYQSTVEGCLTVVGCEGGYAERVTLPGARLTFRSIWLGTKEAPLDGELQAVVETDLVGAFQVQLLAGSYEVRVVSSDGIRVGEDDLRTFSPLVREEPVTDADGDLHAGGRVFSLFPQVRLAGLLEALGNEPRGGVSIDALGGPQLYSQPGEVPAADMLPGEILVNRSAFGATADDGTFSLDLDMGHYDVYFRTPYGSASAWTIWPGFDVRESVEDATVSLGGGSVLVGHVSQYTGEGLAGVTVRAYTQIGDGWLQIGEAVTDGNGNYLTFLPVDP